MKIEKQVTMVHGIAVVQIYYDATIEEAEKVVNIWNNNEGVEYAGNEYRNIAEWLEISKTNGYSLEDII